MGVMPHIARRVEEMDWLLPTNIQASAPLPAPPFLILLAHFDSVQSWFHEIIAFMPLFLLSHFFLCRRRQSRWSWAEATCWWRPRRAAARLALSVCLSCRWSGRQSATSSQDTCPASRPKPPPPQQVTLLLSSCVYLVSMLDMSIARVLKTLIKKPIFGRYVEKGSTQMYKKQSSPSYTYFYLKKR